MEYLKDGYRGDIMQHKRTINKELITDWTLPVTMVTVYMIYVYIFWRWTDVTAPAGYALNIIPVDFIIFIKAAIYTTVTMYPLFRFYKKYRGDKV